MHSKVGLSRYNRALNFSLCVVFRFTITPGNQVLTKVTVRFLEQKVRRLLSDKSAAFQMISILQCLPFKGNTYKVHTY